MMTLQVLCKANKDGCLWKGPLGDLEDHQSECSHVMVSCINDCKKQLKRKDLLQHMATECLLRKIPCDYCNEAVLWTEFEHHFENCIKYPQQCDECGEEGIERGKMEFHLEQLCLNVRVKCPLHIVGCTFEGIRSEVNEHVTAQLSSHLGGYFKYMGERIESGDNSSQQQADQEGTVIQQQQKEIEELKSHVTLLINEVHHLKHQLKETKEAPMRLGIPLQKIKLRKQAGYFCDGIYTWRVEKFRDCCQDALSGSCTAKYSPSFYTSLYPGYNLCMRINLNGVDDGVGKHMALFIHLVRGDHDDFLEWPFAKKFRLSILDQSEDEEVHRHISKILVAESKWQSACRRPVAPYNYYGMGYPKFAPIELICRPQYTKNDTLLVKFEMIA